MWPIYLLAMTTYAYSSARVELWLLASSARWAYGLCLLAVVAISLRVYTRYRRSPEEFVYDESVDAEVQVLGLG